MSKSEEKTDSQKKKLHQPYIISKRTPTQLSPGVKPIIKELTDCAYVACGNLVNVYSLTTNILINTFRSKRQQPQPEGVKAPKGDVHQGNIIAMQLIGQTKLITLCSKGVLAEWDVKTDQGLLIDIYQLKTLTKITQALINEENIAIYDQSQHLFKFFDSQTKSLKITLQENQELKGYVNGIALQRNTFVYIKGRNLVIHDLLEKVSTLPKIIQRDSLLRTVAINQQASLIALGDDFGKIFIVHLSSKQTQVQTLHWHSQRVSTLLFMPDTPYLLSAGVEAVIVQWHLETQNKNFISRIGNAISNLTLSYPSQTYFSATLDDNSVKIIRFDNNKVRSHLQSIQLDRQSIPNVQAQFNDGDLIIAHDNDLQSFTIDDRNVQKLQIKARNFVSAMNQGTIPPKTQVKSFAFTPNRKNLITFESLRDVNSHKDIKIQALKFWSRDIVEDGFQGFEMDVMVHDPCEQMNHGIILSAINNTQIVVINGSKIQIWTQYDPKKWTIQAEFNYQELDVVEVHTNIRFRLDNATKTNQKCLVFLHENGTISFYDQENFEFVHSFRLNKVSKKIVFETSMRYMASLTIEGSIEVWKVKGEEELHQWDLQFKSVTDLINNPCKENQFIITMASNDEPNTKTDSILLFQYSRPQNLIMYWKSQLEFLRVLFCEQKVQTTSYLLIINKNLEFQKIYFGVTRNDLKSISQKRRISMDIKIKDSERVRESDHKTDYQFIKSKEPEDLAAIAERNTLLNLQEAQITRLDKVDQLLSGDQASSGPQSFLGMASLSFYFHEFASEMLPKPSKATTLIDLQEEISQQNHQANADIEMKGEVNSKVFETQDQFVGALSDELEKVFAGLLK